MKLIFSLMFFWCAATVAQEKFEVFFDLDSDVPRPESGITIDHWHRQTPNALVTEILGFTDTTATSAYNLDLAMRRAKNVRRLLSVRKIDFAKDFRLLARGENSARRTDSLNRRVEVRFTPKQGSQADLIASTPGSAEMDEREFEIPKDEFVTDGLSRKVSAQFADAKKGDIIRIHNINFHLNQEKVVRESEAVMQDLLATMKEHPGLRIEIHGHMCCNPNTLDTKLSYRRARTIFNFLRNNGIPLNRLAYKGFGSANPIYPIPEKYYGESVANRRVEILIVATNVK